MKHAAIFVEGYQDRAFINQWLEQVPKQSDGSSNRFRAACLPARN